MELVAALVGERCRLGSGLPVAAAVTAAALEVLASRLSFGLVRLVCKLTNWYVLFLVFFENFDHLKNFPSMFFPGKLRRFLNSINLLTLLTDRHGKNFLFVLRTICVNIKCIYN